MSYARFGPDSDVYVYESGNNAFTCCACKLEIVPWEYGGKAILTHLDEHIQAGHKVPKYCLNALRADLEENKESNNDRT